MTTIASERVLRQSNPRHNYQDVSRCSLTARELQVIALVAEGFSNKLIASELKISEPTVKNHLFSIMTKLGATDRTHAVVIALRRGWISV